MIKMELVDLPLKTANLSDLTKQERHNFLIKMWDTIFN